jgi:hypothetical protein
VRSGFEARFFDTWSSVEVRPDAFVSLVTAIPNFLTFSEPVRHNAIALLQSINNFLQQTFAVSPLGIIQMRLNTSKRPDFTLHRVAFTSVTSLAVIATFCFGTTIDADVLCAAAEPAAGAEDEFRKVAIMVGLVGRSGATLSACSVLPAIAENAGPETWPPKCEPSVGSSIETATTMRGVDIGAIPTNDAR